MGRLQRERKNMDKYAQEREKLKRTEWWTATVCKDSSLYLTISCLPKLTV